MEVGGTAGGIGIDVACKDTSPVCRPKKRRQGLKNLKKENSRKKEIEINSMPQAGFHGFCGKP